MPVPLRHGTRDLTRELLDQLESNPELETSSAFPAIPQNEIKAALDRLASRQMVDYKSLDSELILLTPEGQMICDEGSHEWRVWNAVKSNGKLEMKDLEVSIPSCSRSAVSDR